jgi:hypothetical protein
MMRMVGFRALSIVALFALVGCVGPGSSVSPSLSTDAEHPVTPRVYRDGGITLAVPSSKAAATTAVGAFGACTSGAAECPPGAPDLAELASVTDDQYGEVGAAGAVEHPLNQVLSWVFTWRGVPCPPRLGPRPQSATAPSAAATPRALCDWVVIVDAQSGKYVETYAGPAAE